MEKKLNPNPHERVRQDVSNSWLELPQDLVNSVFERLSFADFQRAKSVCSSWHSASRQQSVCKATYGSWHLMQDPCYNLYIVNLFFHESINLPPMESQLGMTKIERT
ncbi:putative F-box protein At4g22180 [Eutrema salsugineum]|uniref:putative F-box protein At4g22180 n=1 Tax=Eutrema salsugineum TaxID=72664 RepID=UPI000CED6EA1|nr:putative F-box protein At4g22180 [Eutrema salsugineum]